MKTIHKRIGESIQKDYLNEIRLAEALERLHDQEVISEMVEDRRRLLGMGEDEARKIAECVLWENVRLALLPYASGGKTEN